MKERTWIFPMFILVLAPFVWYTNQSNLYSPPILLKKPFKNSVPIVEILLFTTII